MDNYEDECDCNELTIKKAQASNTFDTRPLRESEPRIVVPAGFKTLGLGKLADAP